MAQSEFHNVAIVAEKMVCDGARVSLPHMGDDMYFQNKEYVNTLLEKAGMTAEQIARAVKTDVVSGGQTGNRRLIDVWWLNAEAANIVLRANEHFAHSVSEVHMKVFFAQKGPQEHSRFIDAMWSSRFAITMAAFRGKPNEKSRRTAGHKGARIGNPKSDNHKVIYKGRDEKTGMECHIKGRQLARIKETARERHTTVKRTDKDAKFWDTLVDEVGYHAAHSLMKSLREMGINVTDFFKGVSSVSWEKPLHGDDTEALDAEQEAWYIQAVTKRKASQLPMFEEE